MAPTVSPGSIARWSHAPRREGPWPAGSAAVPTGGGLGAAVQGELGQDVGHVALPRVGGEVQAQRDVLVALARGEMSEDLLFAHGER